MSQSVPFIDLSRYPAEWYTQVVAAWEHCLRTTQFVGGEEVAKFEVALARRLGVNHAVSCANGTDALIVALQAAGVKAGDKVAVPAVTFWAVYEAVVQIGAVPVFVDIDPEDLHLSLEELKKAHSQFGLSAAIYPHMFGWTSKAIFSVRNFAQREGIRLIEDGAQGFGVTMEDGSSVFSGADIATQSFYPAKVFGGCMDGGAVLTSSENDAEIVRSLCNHGRDQHFLHGAVGWNSRMSGLQAAFLNIQIAQIDSILQDRLASLAFYSEQLGDLARARLFLPPDGIGGNGYLAVVNIESSLREPFQSTLKQAGIGTGQVYPVPMHLQAPATNSLRISDLTNSERFCSQVVNLPLFYGMTSEELEKVVSVVNGFFAQLEQPVAQNQ